LGCWDQALQVQEVGLAGDCPGLRKKSEESFEIGIDDFVTSQEMRIPCKLDFMKL